MRQPKIPYRCPGCEITRVLKRGRHYCKCNPAAPFLLDDMTLGDSINRMISQMLGQMIRRDGGNPRR